MKIITDIEKLAGLKPDQLAQILREQAAYPADTQQAVLMNILGHSKNSAFGKKYGFAKNPGTFRARSCKTGSFRVH